MLSRSAITVSKRVVASKQLVSRTVAAPGFSAISSMPTLNSSSFRAAAYTPLLSSVRAMSTDNTQTLIAELSKQQSEAVSTMVPWFMKNMPASYFKQVPDSLRRQHLKSIAALRELRQSDMVLKIDAKNEDGSSEVTFISNISSASSSNNLYDQIKSLVVPQDSTLSRVKVFSSADNSLALNIFSFETNKSTNTSATKDDIKAVVSLAKEISSGKFSSDARYPSNNSLFSETSLNEYASRCTPGYVKNSDPRRFLIQRDMYEKVRNSESTAIHIEAAGQTAGAHWISIAAANTQPEVLLRLSSNILASRKLTVGRSHLDVVRDPENSTEEIAGSVTMLRLLVNGSLDMGSASTQTLLKDLRRAKWLDDEVIDFGLFKHPHIGTDKAEIIVALCSMLHGPLSKTNAQAYASIKSVVSTISRSPHFTQQADAIAQLFLDKFNVKSPISATEFSKRYDEISGKIARLQDEAARTVLSKMLEAVKAALRTNLYHEDRYALGMKMHPSIMATGNMGKVDNRPLPFGVLFVHGRLFNGFHNRFRDIARGGLRVVTPQNSDQHALESTRQFDEVYGLSYAQQLKNKDIPEGGSKAVVLVNSPMIPVNSRFFAMRKSVKAFSDSVLDLICKESVARITDYYGKEELIYLGPDEQIIPSDIDWICDRAAKRGYPIPAAFMSSKKLNGFNHKEFGVTSEGIVTFMDVALRNVLKIDPYKQPFTLKITGGPDGDVAGNLMKIVFREYNENCKVLGVADGFGVAEDPKGLNSGELIRLFNEGLPITAFNRSKLSPEGILMDASTEEGLTRRNSMCFRVKSDAFVPGGGRPNTINADNWKQFLDADGKPSSPLIVEGANIFTTPEARELLFKNANVKIVKDSSANKCGVVTSSFEVMCSMVLSKQEFMDNKKALVADVLVKLKHIARLEANLLFKEFDNYPGALPHFSERISAAINNATDAITDALDNVKPSDSLFQELLPLVKESLPTKLAELAWSRVPSKFPIQYQKNAIASALASNLVYKEGIHLIETQPAAKLAERAFLYYRESRKVDKLIAEFEASNSGISKEKKEEIVKLLRIGGARASLNIF